MRFRKSDFVFIGLAIVLVPFVLSAGGHWHAVRQDQLCLTHLKQMGLALHQYIRDYDERFPLGATWSTALMPYMKRSDVQVCPVGPQTTYYAFERRLPSLNLAKVTYPAEGVMVFDSNITHDNAIGGSESLPQVARHISGHGIDYIDGHAAFNPHPKFRLDLNAPLPWSSSPTVKKGAR